MINRIIIVAHCLLNYHSKIIDSDVSNKVSTIIIPPLLQRGYGLLQLPCPEFTHGGLLRWGQSRSQYNNRFFISHCSKLAENIINQLEEYLRCSYVVGPVLGINGSPSCGIDFSFDGPWGGEIGSTDKIAEKAGALACVRQPGVFMEVLKSAAIKREINLQWIGVDENNPEVGLEEILDGIDSPNGNPKEANN